MDMKITSRLLIMMFVQYFMQGAWNMTMGLVLSTYGRVCKVFCVNGSMVTE